MNLSDLANYAHLISRNAQDLGAEIEKYSRDNPPIPPSNSVFRSASYYQLPAMMAQNHPDIASYRYSDTGNWDGTTAKNGCLFISFWAYCLAAGVFPLMTGPKEFAQYLNMAKCFNGNYFSHPSRFESYLVTQEGWDASIAARVHWNEYREWADGPADLTIIAEKLAKSPAIFCLDYTPRTATIETHWVVGLGLIAAPPLYPTRNNMIIFDSIIGRVRLLSDYFDARWGNKPVVERTILAMWDLG